MKHSIVVLAALVFGASSVAQAQNRSDQMSAMLGYFPSAWLTSDSNLGLSFHDLAAARRVAVRRGISEGSIGGVGGIGAYLRLVLLPPELSDALPFGLEGAWEERIGFGPDDVSAILSVEDLPAQLFLMDLVEGMNWTEVKGALLDDGYEARELGAWSALWRGEDAAIDFALVDNANPFGGRLGRGSRVAMNGDVLAYSPAWPLIEELAAGGVASLSADSRLEALLAALNDPHFGDAELVQATILPVPWPAIDAAAVTTSSQTVQEDVGLPPWQLGLMADLSNGPVDYGVAALVFADRATAEGLVDRLLSGWQEQPLMAGRHTLAEATGGEATAFVVGDDPAALVLAIQQPAIDQDDIPRNRAYHALVNTYLRGDLALLGVR